MTDDIGFFLARAAKRHWLEQMKKWAFEKYDTGRRFEKWLETNPPEKHNGYEISLEIAKKNLEQTQWFYEQSLAEISQLTGIELDVLYRVELD